MEEKVVKMVIYYVLALNDDEKKNIVGCIEITKLLLAMVKNEETKADRLLNILPKEHPVSKLYAEIRELEKEELIAVLEKCKEKFSNYNAEDVFLDKIEDDIEVEELSKRIAK